MAEGGSTDKSRRLPVRANCPLPGPTNGRAMTRPML
ncbi:Uncharacterised protein [Vibrio cholerae]|nr:Uncharacterised protein [Vibrio cholerae]